MKRYGYIYMTKNLVNGKMYIGLHKGESLDVSYAGSGVALKNAFDKYGRDNFVNGILEYADNFEDLTILEQLYIEQYNTYYDRNHYNMTPGGDVSPMTIGDISKKVAETQTKKYAVYDKQGRFLTIIKSLAKVAEYTNTSLSAVKHAKKRNQLAGGKYQVLDLTGETPENVSAKLTHSESVSKMRMKQLIQYTLDGAKLNVYAGIKVAAEENNINYQTLRSALQRNNKAGGYVWKYAS